MSKLTRLTATLFLTASVTAAIAAPTVVFQTNFEGPLPTELSPGTAVQTAVQGYAGLGSTGNQFGGNFLRSETGNTVTLQLNNLPTHNTISLEFLFAAIDSLDGTGTFPQGDFFKIVFDGVTLFSESFANADLSYQIQSYAPPAGVTLARLVNLGFSQGFYYSDSAYNLGADPRFANFAHTGSTAKIDFYIFGPGNQSLSDESWAMDNLRVSVVTTGNGNVIPEPGSLALLGLGLSSLAILRRRQLTR
ncbi:MAG: PEP-CTERM sorting domain-containing protein [Rhodoferax sp.]|uniref:PEP-CTERM sorting domain-containing protein n=1 Tax=Rhodoferax sp. TaxID=50421 RepID=UPI0027290DD1|nr:PEP-CTERM sorting domain-containing protein [Rhodoferax sp.]MDO8449197.1 PEP-CTERM sorting domain-containing protein [Rhodoferax sp.]